MHQRLGRLDRFVVFVRLVLGDARLGSDIRPIDTGGVWSTRYDTEKQYWLLDYKAQAMSECNAAAKSYVRGAEGLFESGCWQTRWPPLDVVANVLPGTPKPNLPGFSTYAARIVATPESDPCVPCVGQEDDPDETEVDTSETGKLPRNVRADAVYLKLDNNFILLSLTRAELDAIAAGSMNTLSIPNSWTAVNNAVQQSSLWFLLTTQPEDCLVNPTNCYYISTPVTLN